MSWMQGATVMKGRGLVGGIAEGEALVSGQSLVWSHGVDPATGTIDDVQVAVCGQSVKNKILIYPHGKGSTSGATWMLETARYGNAPLAIVNRETELIIVAGAILSEVNYGRQIPVVDGLDGDPTTEIESGDWVRVDGTNGTVEIVERKNALHAARSGEVR